MESIEAAQRHLGGRGAAGKERYLIWNTSLRTALSTPGQDGDATQLLLVLASMLCGYELCGGRRLECGPVQPRK
jgi:hypothetical protein